MEKVENGISKDTSKETNLRENDLNEQKMKRLRELMIKNSYDAYIVPHSDRHDVFKIYF